MVSKVFEWGFREHVDKVKHESKHLTKLVQGIHENICKKFLPLPSKSHYIFNLRDLMKLVQGILSVSPDFYSASSINI